jgi:hypothetical protein
MMNHYADGGEVNEIQGAVFDALLGEAKEEEKAEEAASGGEAPVEE